MLVKQVLRLPWVPHAHVHLQNGHQQTAVSGGTAGRLLQGGRARPGEGKGGQNPGAHLADLVGVAGVLLQARIVEPGVIVVRVGSHLSKRSTPVQRRGFATI